MWRRYFARTLRDNFDRLKKKNKSFSMRAYARVIGVSPGTISEIFGERRKISPQLALQIAQKAKFDSAALQRLRQLISMNESETPRRVLSAQAVELIMNPLYYRLVCALDILPSPTTADEIASFLAADGDEVARVIEVLRDLEIVDTKGTAVSWRGQHVITPPDVPNARVQAFHRGTLKDAAADLRLPVHEREYTTVVFAANESRMESAKRQIRAFRDDLAESMRDSRPDRIYQLSVQLRPVSKRLSEEKA